MLRATEKQTISSLNFCQFDAGMPPEGKGHEIHWDADGRKRARDSLGWCRKEKGTRLTGMLLEGKGHETHWDGAGRERA